MPNLSTTQDKLWKVSKKTNYITEQCTKYTIYLKCFITQNNVNINY